MFDPSWLWIMGLAVLTAVALAGWWRSRRLRGQMPIDQARRLFHLQRERLEHRFLLLASQSGKPRGLEWVECDFADEVAFARDRNTGLLRALVGVTIRFRPIVGGGMEDNPNAENLRAATALFHLEGRQWNTDGRALFNLNPQEAIRHYQQELEVVE
jgi:hypothetical protein